MRFVSHIGNAFKAGEQMRLGLLLLFLPALLVRFIQPLQFPMIFWDEGLWNLGPKHAVLLGDPFAFGWYHAFLSPLHYLTTLLLYNLFTPSLVLSRLLSGLFGAGVILFTYLLGKRFFGGRAALVAAVLVAYNSMMIFSSRQAMLEQEVAFYMVAAAFFWFHPERKLIWISGLFLAAALLVKVIAAAIFPALVLGQLLLNNHKSSELKPRFLRISSNQWLGIFLGLSLACGCYFLIAQLDPDLFTKAWLTHTVDREKHFLLGEVPHKLWDLRSIFHFLAEFALHFPALLLLAAIGFILALKKRLTPGFFLMGWLIFTFILVSMQIYRPARYYYPIIPALALLASVALTTLFPADSKNIRGKVALFSVVAILCIIQLVILIPHYKQGSHTNMAMIEAANWLNNNAEPGEPVLSMYQTALLINNPIIPAPEFVDERWKAANDPQIVTTIPWARFLCWTTFKIQKSTPITRWAYEFTSENFEVVARFGKFITIWERKESDAVPASLQP